MMSNISFYSYSNFFKNRSDFKITDRDGINRFDTPNALFYKLVFYFSDESGLLGLDGINGFTDDVTKGLDGIDVKKDRIKNTAYNFLLLNDELERAEMLKNFLILLSEINSKSPWYFQEISGIDSALERKVFSEGELKIEDKPGQFTIKCLNDACDDRIGTLLDLYRACCFSYQNKKEIVPRNLRKFNMGILLFSAPMRGKGGKSGDPNNRIKIPYGDETNFYIPSTKLIEFRNCEIDYNSAKSPFATLNTSEAPFSPEYTITINFDDCYESRYNEIMQQVVTDFINIDINSQRDGNNLKDVNSKGKYSSVDEKINNSIKIDTTDKGYWVNTDYSQDNIYNPGVIEGQIKTMEDILSARGINMDKTVENSKLVDGKRVVERRKIVDDYYKTTDFGDDAIPERKEQSANLSDNHKQNSNYGDDAIPERKEQSANLSDNHKQNSNYGDSVSKLEGSTDMGEVAPPLKGKSMLANAFEGKVQAIGDLIKDAVQIPKIKTTTNIHDIGDVSNYGEFEYLNRITGSDGILGNVAQQVVGLGVKALKDKVNKLYLGNLYETSVSDVLDITKRALSGNVAGTIGAIKNLSPNSSSKLPERKEELYSNTKQRELGFNPITDELYSDTSQREIGFNPTADELYSDTQQRELGFNPITHELWSDTKQRTIGKTEGELPGYIKGRTKLLNKLNKKSSIRNTL